MIVHQFYSDCGGAGDEYGVYEEQEESSEKEFHLPCGQSVAYGAERGHDCCGDRKDLQNVTFGFAAYSHCLL